MVEDACDYVGYQRAINTIHDYIGTHDSINHLTHYFLPRVSGAVRERTEITRVGHYGLVQPNGTTSLFVKVIEDK